MALDDVVESGTAYLQNQGTYQAFEGILHSGMPMDAIPALVSEMANNPKLYQDLIKEDEARLYKSVRANLADVLKNTDEDRILDLAFQHSKEYATAAEIQEKLAKKDYEAVKKAYANLFEPDLIKRIIMHKDFSEESLRKLAQGYIARMQQKFIRDNLVSKKGDELDINRTAKFFEALDEETKKPVYIALGQNYVAQYLAKKAEEAKAKEDSHKKGK